MDKIKYFKSKIEDISPQNKLKMFYVEELEDRLEMSAIYDATNSSCWGGPTEDPTETGANTAC